MPALVQLLINSWVVVSSPKNKIGSMYNELRCDALFAIANKALWQLFG
jgi:hypothetical protein